MRKLLKREGGTFKGELVDMDKHFWHPKEITSKKKSTKSKP